MQSEWTQVFPLLRVYTDDADTDHEGQAVLCSMAIRGGTLLRARSLMTSDELCVPWLMSNCRHGAIPTALGAWVHWTRTCAFAIDKFPFVEVHAADLRLASLAWPQMQRSLFIRPSSSKLPGLPQGCAQGTLAFRTVFLFLTDQLVSEATEVSTLSSGGQEGTGYVGNEDGDEEPAGELSAHVPYAQEDTQT